MTYEDAKEYITDILEDLDQLVVDEGDVLCGVSAKLIRAQSNEIDRLKAELAAARDKALVEAADIVEDEANYWAGLREGTLFDRTKKKILALRTPTD